MKIVTTANITLYQSWYAEALADESVWPFMTFDPRWAMAKVDDDDWHRLLVLDDTGYGLLEIGFERGDQSARLALWVRKHQSRAIIAAGLLRTAAEMASRYGLTMLDAACHGSNEASKRLLERTLGKPWGVKPLGAWNGKLGQYEDSLHFRASREDLQANVKKICVEDA